MKFGIRRRIKDIESLRTQQLMYYHDPALYVQSRAHHIFNLPMDLPDEEFERKIHQMNLQIKKIERQSIIDYLQDHLKDAAESLSNDPKNTREALRIAEQGFLRMKQENVISDYIINVWPGNDLNGAISAQIIMKAEYIHLGASYEAEDRHVDRA